MHGGTYAFHGGENGPAGPWGTEIHQDVDVSALASEIDAGTQVASFSACARSHDGGGGSFIDHASIEVQYRDVADIVLDSFSALSIEPVNVWNVVTDTRPVPPGTRTIRVRLLSTRQVGVSTEGFHDDVTLTVTTKGSVGVPEMRHASWSETKSRYR